MLRELDSVDWSKHRHAYGSAADFPGLLRGVVSPDPETRNKAWYTLHGNVWHQGTVWEATAYTVPFFVQLLDEEDVPQKHRILEFLSLLASPSNLEGPAPGLDAPPELRTEWEECVAWGKASHEAVASRLDGYLRFLGSPEMRERMGAHLLLAQLPEHRAAIGPRLKEALNCEKDERAAASAVRAIGKLLPADSEARSLLTQLVKDGARPLVRLCAAMALVPLETAPGEDMLRVLAAAIEKPAPVAESYAELPWARFRVDLDVSELAKALPPSAAGIMGPALMKAVERSTAMQAPTHIDALLRVVFGPVDWERVHRRDRTLRPAASLTSEQRRVLEALVERKDIWFFGSGPTATKNGNLSVLFVYHQLPNDRDELERYLKK